MRHNEGMDGGEGGEGGCLREGRLKESVQLQ